MNKKLATALPSMESLEESASLALDHTDALDYGSSEADAYAREATMDGRELESQIDKIEGGFTDIASVESLVAAIESARDVGMEMGSAQFMQIHLNNVHQRYGIESLETAVPALECFQERRARLATSISLESVKETLRTIWAWIKEQIAKFAQMITQLFRRMTKSLDYVAKEADVLKQKARRLKYDGGDKFDLGRAADKLRMEGVVSKDFTSQLNNVGALTRVAEDTYATLGRDVMELMTEFMKNLPDTSAIKEYTVKVPVPSSFASVSRGDENAFGEPPLNVCVSRPLPGDRVVQVGTFTKDNQVSFDGMFGVRHYGRTIVSDIHETVETVREVEALSSMEVFTLCQRLQKTVASLKASREEMENHIKKVHQMIDQMTVRGLQEHGANIAPIRGVCSMIVKLTVQYGGELFRTCDKVAFDVCVGYLAYGKRSIAVAEQKGAAVGQASSVPALPASA